VEVVVDASVFSFKQLRPEACEAHWIGAIQDHRRPSNVFHGGSLMRSHRSDRRATRKGIPVIVQYRDIGALATPLWMRRKLQY
jgi:hypothetical protein